MVVGAFTNSSLFLMYALFPVLDPAAEVYTPSGAGFMLSNIYLYASLLLTSYGFGKAAVLVFKHSLANDAQSKNCKRCGRELN
jgi:hypothetical protein